MRQKPFRPDSDISQSYNSGIVTVYRLTDRAEPGRFPVPEPEKTAALRYEEQKVGLHRYYQAMQNQVRVEKVIRVPKGPVISPQDLAVTEDGQQYRIDLVQLARDVWPPSLDLTLARVDQIYELGEEEQEE